MAESQLGYRLGKLVAAALPDGLVLVACSGGADSLALAAVTAQIAKAQGLQAGAVIVDHRLQSGSEEVAAKAAEQCRQLGLSPVKVVAVEVDPANGGLEAAARDARYAALTEAARKLNAEAVLLAHTRDDQAETVLLGLARGSGARSIAGMPAIKGLFRRPFLHITRAETEQLCAGQGLHPYQDPHNEDPRFARVRVRRQVMPALREALGEAAVDALARTAQLLQADNEALDEWAQTAAEDRVEKAGEETVIKLTEPSQLKNLPTAVRTRLIRQTLITAGVPAHSLTSHHLKTIDTLIAGWKGQGPARVPGDMEVARKGSQLVIYPAPGLQ